MNNFALSRNAIIYVVCAAGNVCRLSDHRHANHIHFQFDRIVGADVAVSPAASMASFSSDSDGGVERHALDQCTTVELADDLLGNRGCRPCKRTGGFRGVVE